jgi:hypothetical protein
MADQTNWTGSVWGATTKGTVAAEIMRQGNRIEGKILLFEPGLGQLQALLSGEWSDSNKITATLHQFTGNYSVPVILPQTGSMDGTFEPTESVIAGEWRTDAQTGGKILLVKIEVQQAMQPNVVAGSPATSVTQATPATSASIPALITKTVVLGSYRLDDQSVRRLADLVKSGTNVALPAINASYRGTEHIHIGVDNLLADPSVPNVVYDLVVAASEPATNTGTSTVTLNLKKNDRNTLFISGYNQLWVEGKSAQIQDFLREHESKGAHILRSYGSNLNFMIFLVMLAFLPSISSLRHRLIVVAFVFGLLLLLMYSWRLAANTKVFLREDKAAWYQKNAGWLLVVLEVGLAAFVGYLIQRFMMTH